MTNRAVLGILAGAAGIAWLGTTLLAEPQKQSAAIDEDAPREKAQIGERAPDFALKDTEGATHTLREYVADGKIVVLEWFNPDCPFVKKHHEKYKSMASTFDQFQAEDVVWLAVNSGGPGKQGYGLDRNADAREKYRIEYPILLDETGEVGRLYQAKTTPHMYVIAEGILVYRGALDENRSAGKLGEENYVADALTCVLEGRKIEPAETKSYGCLVKYTSAKI